MNWIFPRLLVGNFCHQPKALSITHSYYDCENAVSESDYWAVPESNWFTAALMVPVACAQEDFTNLYFYPIYSASKLAIDVEIYSSSGACLGRKKAAVIVESPGQNLEIIKLKALLDELNIPKDQPLGARLMASPIDGSRVPARIKLGLDLGSEKVRLPCNICTNLQPFNPRWEGHNSQSFKWAPLLADQP